jgi:cell division initiation protein
MTITAQDIQSKQFHVRMRGFDVDEVDKFLEKVAEEFLIITLENKQILEKIEEMEKELANFRNKEQAFQSAILSAQKVSDEMQNKSRKESEELMAKAKAKSDEMRSAAKNEAEESRNNVQKELAELIEKSRSEAKKLKSDAAEEARNLEETAKKQHVELIDTINELVEIKDRIVADIGNLLDNYKSRLEDDFPKGLIDLKAMERPEGYEPHNTSQVLSQDDQDALATDIEDVFDPDLDNLYEKMELPDSTGSEANDDQPATLDTSDIEPIGPDDEVVNLADVPIPNMEGDDMLFTLEDPMDELEPTVLINKDEK